MHKLQNDLSEAIFMVHKPLGWTSFDVVKKIRCALKIKKIGHAGTLDPLATGLLLLCSGRQTKTISTLQGLDKVYTGQMVLGKTTPSMDLETPFNSLSSYDHITEEMVHAAAATFVGAITQIPPIYSAIKIGGKRAYKMARQGEAALLLPRSITIHAFLLTAFNLPFVDFKLVCSKGTYVRSLIHDLGQKLGVGAYLHALCRTQIGNYCLEQAYSLEELLQPDSLSV
ncbi:tRNA pseudouridine synthase B [Cardinium endosymbiont cEper1 of Encarsia pergandiella]|uniref:tRNA pseudouridine(55) synthase TruB n=1 Tax=Cardinium endosymbiont of Encarsia pergandiella TaxID=249402 RepID=UPI00027EA9EC|nr:tRNA pseudouridine(55) synthase TruB [Cardinium endosymbiont of Encarsia pergandiella]CCM09866.1 tRNA pseudouridine synthase B [Cardinium endosymbiont cEper1 of Encarsia pergandiella]